MQYLLTSVCKEGSDKENVGEVNDMAKYLEPKLNENSFTCPNCNTLSGIAWDEYTVITHDGGVYLNQGSYEGYSHLSISKCVACDEIHIWLDEKMIYPLISGIPMPNEDMPQNVKEIYMEARDVYPYSKRATAALLRLAVQVLCKELGEKGKNINDDIGELVKKGLSVQIQQALDSIRVIGNNAVHPGEITLEEHEDVAGILFTLINIIVEQLITQPKKIAEVYGLLPIGALESIEKRDNN